MMAIGVDERVEDLLERVQRLAEEDRIDEAVELVMALDGWDLQLVLISSLSELITTRLVRAFVLYLALARDLSLALSPARNLARDLATARGLATVRGRYLARIRARARAHALDLDLDHALGYSRDVDRILDRARSGAFDLDLDLASDLSLERALDRARDRELAPELDIERELVLSLERALDHARDPELERDVQVTLGLNRLLIGILTRILGDDDTTAEIEAGESGMQSDGTQRVIFVLEGVKTLTPRILGVDVVPYLQALVDFQAVLSQIKGEPIPGVRIRSITQNSPFGVEMSGVGDALRVVINTVVPWRRKYAKERADLEKAQLEASILDARAGTAQKRVDVKKTEEEVRRAADPEREALEKERLRLENEEMRLAIEERRAAMRRSNVELALTIIEKVGAGLQEPDRTMYLSQLLSPLQILAESPLQPLIGNQADAPVDES